MWVLHGHEDDGMNLERFGDITLYRPKLQSELHVRKDAEANLRSAYAAGKYTDKTGINGVLQYHFGYYDGLLKKLLPEIASLHLMEFVLTQYDHSVEIDKKRRSKQLDYRETERWDRLGPTFRRAVKYLALHVVNCSQPEQECCST